MICLLIALLKGYRRVALPPAKIIPFMDFRLILRQRYNKKLTLANLSVNFYTFMCIFLLNKGEKCYCQGGEHQHGHLPVQSLGMCAYIPYMPSPDGYNQSYPVMTLKDKNQKT